MNRNPPPYTRTIRAFPSYNCIQYDATPPESGEALVPVGDEAEDATGDVSGNARHLSVSSVALRRQTHEHSPDMVNSA